MEILWKYALPTNEQSNDYQYESPIFVKGEEVLFICKNSRDTKKDSLYIIDKNTGALKNEIAIGGHTVIPSECFFESVAGKVVIYTGSLWTYTEEEGLRSLCGGMFERENEKYTENLSVYEIAAMIEEMKRYKITSHLVFGDCLIFSDTYNLYCVDVRKSMVKWSTDASNSTSLPCGSIYLFEDKISFYGSDRLLFADISSGDIVDEIKIPRITKLFSPIRMSDGTLLIGYTNWSGAGVLRYDPIRKKVIWKSKRSFEGPLSRCVLLLYNNLAYWCKNDTELICVNIDNGEEVYSISTRPWLYTDPLLKSGRIIFGTSGADGFLKNIDAESGEEIWSLPLKNGCASFSFHGDTVIAGDFEKKLYRIDFASGKILRELNVGGEVVGKVSVENGSAYTVVWGNEAEPIKLIKVRLY